MARWRYSWLSRWSVRDLAAAGSGVIGCGSVQLISS